MYKILASLIFFGTIMTSGYASEEKIYIKIYYSNGIIKAEGWQMGASKTDDWIFYHSNDRVASKGHIEKEGHYVNGSAEDWWVFYDIESSKTIKFQYRNNLKNGYSLCYKNTKLIKAEKYINDKKVGEWNSFIAFKLDNSGVSF